MTALVCLAILLFGVVAFRALPVAALPSVDYPTIQVSAALPGASPETMASSVATPLERQFSTIAGIQSMSSMNSQGSTQITVQFDLSRNIDAAAQDIQAAIAAAGGQLPPSMPRPPSYQKVNPAEQPVLYLALDSDTLPLYTRDRIRRQRCWRSASPWSSGVSRVQVFGEQKYAVRVQVDPDQLAAHNIGIDEVQQRHRSQQHQPAHRHGWTARKQAFTIESSGAPAQCGGLPAHHRGLAQRRAGAPGAVGQRDRRRGERQADRLVSTTSRGVMLAIERQPGTNTVEVVDNIKRLLPEFRARDSALGATLGGVRRVGIHPQLDPRRGVHAGADRLRGGDGDLPLPAQPFGHPDSRRARCRFPSSARSP